jgi:hypothetical protein
MSIIESFARIAFALRNDVSVRNFVPFDSVLSRFALFVIATRTDRMISVDIEPSFLMSSEAAWCQGERSWKNPSGARDFDRR